MPLNMEFNTSPLSKLDRVISEVQKNLTESAAIRTHRRAGSGERRLEREALAFRCWTKGSDYLIHHVLALHRFEVDFHFAGFYFCQVEKIVDQRKQMSRAGLNCPQMPLLVR